MKLKKTIIFAWELGGGLGHIHRLLRVATQFSDRDYQLVFAIKTKIDAAIIGETLSGAKIFDAPVFRRSAGERPPPAACNYADILYYGGYDSASTLLAMVKAWRQIFQAFNPACIICDHSPTAILAASAGWPAIHIGSGFATPPAGKSFLTLNAAAICLDHKKLPVNPS